MQMQYREYAFVFTTHDCIFICLKIKKNNV